MRVNKFIKTEIDLEIIGATLLSIEEAKLVPEEIRAIEDWWWLRSPGDNTNMAAYVNYSGNVYAFGYFVNDGNSCIRPAVIISNLSSSNLKIGDKIEVKDMMFTVVSDTLALIDEPIGSCAFRKDYKASNANDYEASDVKKYVEEWFNELIN